MALIRPLKLRSEKIAAKKIKALVDPLAHVIVDTKIFHLSEPYSYLVSEDITDTLKIGTLVRIPFGRSMAEGVVIHRGSADSTAGLKFIGAQLSSKPMVSNSQIRFFKEVSQRYGCSLWDVMRLAIPSFSRGGERGANLPALTLRNSSEKQTPSHQVITLKAGSVLSDEVSKIAKECPDSKILVVVPDTKTLEKLRPIATIVLSAELGKSEKYSRYLEANSLSSGIVVGLRSSIFLHLNPSDQIIVVDEADENLYEKHSPTFNVRDVALLRAVEHSLTFISPCHSLEIERLIDIGYLEERPEGKFSRTVFTEPENSAHAIISQGLKRGPVLVVHANSGYVKSFVCNNCRNIALCGCGEKLVLRRDGKGTHCPLCNAQASSWSCPYCSKSIPRSLSQGVIKRAEDYGKSFPNIHVLSVSAESVVKELPSQRCLVISTPGMEPDGRYAAICLMDGEQIFGRTGLRSDEQGQLLWSKAVAKLSDGGQVFVSLPNEHPVVQGLIRNSWTRTHRSEISARSSAHLPPEHRLICIEGEPSEMAALMSALDTLREDTPFDSLGPMDRPKGLSRIILKFPVSLGATLTHKIYEINRVRSLQGRKVLRVSVDPYEFI